MKREGKTFIIITNDGPERNNVFISWDADKGYYTTVDWIDEISDLDFMDDVGTAMERAKEVNSSTLGGWNWAPMTIAELLNFDEAYNNNAEPEFKEIVTVTFK